MPTPIFRPQQWRSGAARDSAAGRERACATPRPCSRGRTRPRARRRRWTPRRAASLATRRDVDDHLARAERNERGKGGRPPRTREGARRDVGSGPRSPSRKYFAGRRRGTGDSPQQVGQNPSRSRGAAPMVTSGTPRSTAVRIAARAPSDCGGLGAVDDDASLSARVVGSVSDGANRSSARSGATPRRPRGGDRSARGENEHAHRPYRITPFGQPQPVRSRADRIGLA